MGVADIIAHAHNLQQGKMTLYRYFRSEASSSSLPDPHGPLSKVMSHAKIHSCNESPLLRNLQMVMCRRMRGLKFNSTKNLISKFYSKEFL